MEENRIKAIEAYGKRRKDEAIKKELAEKNEKEILLAKICYCGKEFRGWIS